MAESIVEGFSVSHVAILDGTTGAEEVDGDIYGVRDASLEVDADSFENTGDDSVLSTWDWMNFATVSVTSGFLPFDMISLIYGYTVVESGVAPDDYYTLPLWDEGDTNISARPLLIRVPSRDKDGVSRVLDIVLFKCFFSSIAFEGPSYKEGLTISYTARAVLSDVDETGASLPSRRVGKLISKPS